MSECTHWSVWRPVSDLVRSWRRPLEKSEERMRCSPCAWSWLGSTGSRTSADSVRCSLRSAADCVWGRQRHCWRKERKPWCPRETLDCTATWRTAQHSCSAGTQVIEQVFLLVKKLKNERDCSPQLEMSHCIEKSRSCRSCSPGRPSCCKAWECS